MNQENESPRYGRPERYIGRTITDLRVLQTPDGDRLCIHVTGLDEYLDIRAERLFY